MAITCTRVAAVGMVAIEGKVTTIYYTHTHTHTYIYKSLIIGHTSPFVSQDKT